MGKKSDEKEILFSLYKKDLIEATLKEDETPDFILTDPVNGEQIGVEVTTLFTNQASAISKSDKFLDSYIDSHIAQSKQPNKKKKPRPPYLQNLNVTPIEGDDSLVHKSHVVWQIVGLKDYFSFVENIIQTKSKAYEKKIKGLQFVNLIGKDLENYFRPHNAVPGYLYNLLRQHRIFQTIINSNFQEIFFITAFKVANYSIPLKWLIFHSEYFLFKLFWQELNKDNKERLNDLKLLLDNFCVCMIHLGYKNIYLNSDGEHRYLFFGTSYWKIDKKTNELTEHDFFALKLSEENLAKNILKNNEKYSPLFESYIEFRKEKGCVLDEGAFRKLTS